MIGFIKNITCSFSSSSLVFAFSRCFNIFPNMFLVLYTYCSFLTTSSGCFLMSDCLETNWVSCFFVPYSCFWDFLSLDCSFSSTFYSSYSAIYHLIPNLIMLKKRLVNAYLKYIRDLRITLAIRSLHFLIFRRFFFQRWLSYNGCQLLMRLILLLSSPLSSKIITLWLNIGSLHTFNINIYILLMIKWNWNKMYNFRPFRSRLSSLLFLCFIIFSCFPFTSYVRRWFFIFLSFYRGVLC